MEIIWSDLAVQQLDEIAEYVQDNYGEFTSRKMAQVQHRTAIFW